MFGAGYRTPAKGSQVPANPDTQMSPVENTETGTGSLEAMASTDSRVRRSIGDWETGKTGPNLNRPSPPIKEANSGSSKLKAKVLSQAVGATARGTATTVTAASLVLETVKPRGRVAEAKACLVKAKLQINSSRNLKAEIRADVIQAVERLYRLVKEAEDEKPPSQSSAGRVETTRNDESKAKDLELELIQKLNEHGKMLLENTQEMSRLKQQILKIEENRPAATYASVAATSVSQPVHSMVVSSVDAHDTSEDVLSKIRAAVSAKTSGIRVDRLRKARDQKVVLGCQSREELTKVVERLKSDSPTLQIEEKANKDPLVIMHNVLNINSDEDILGALRKQNTSILGMIPEGDYRASVRYRRKARNPLESHVVLQVSPPVWLGVTTMGKVHIDLQRVVVKDQSPLMQCSRCLGYGHGRKNCKESVDTCSHCTGPHLRSECPAWKAGDRPTCRNCQGAKLEQTDHNCFEGSCPIRRKWDALARARVAYC